LQLRHAAPQIDLAMIAENPRKSLPVAASSASSRASAVGMKRRWAQGVVAATDVSA